MIYEFISKNFLVVLAGDRVGCSGFDGCQLVNAKRAAGAAVADFCRRGRFLKFGDGGANLPE